MATDDHHDDPQELVRTVPSAPAPRGLMRRIVDGLVREPPATGFTYLLLDMSASMGHRGKMRQVQLGAIRFFAEAWNMGYAVGVIGFSQRPRFERPPTRDFSRFQRSLRELHPSGRTAMARAIRLAIRRLRRRDGDRAILLITDGMPEDADATLRSARQARALGITLIAVGTDPADQTFLAALAGRAELARHVPEAGVADEVRGAAGSLPRGVDA